MNKLKDLFWDDYYGLPTGIGAVVIILGVIILGLLIGGFFANLGCKKSFADYNPQWGIMSGCRIEWQDKLTPVGMIKNINI